MADRELRELERRVARGDPEALARLLRAKARAGRAGELGLELLQPLLPGSFRRLVRAIRRARGEDPAAETPALSLSELLDWGPGRLLLQVGCGPVTLQESARAVVGALGLSLPPIWDRVLEEAGLRPVRRRGARQGLSGAFLVEWSDPPAPRGARAGALRLAHGEGTLEVAGLVGRVWRASPLHWRWEGRRGTGRAAGDAGLSLLGDDHLLGRVALGNGPPIRFTANRLND